MQRGFINHAECANDTLVGSGSFLDVTRGYRYVAQSGFRTAVQIRLVDVETVAGGKVRGLGRGQRAILVLFPGAARPCSVPAVARCKLVAKAW